MESCPDGETLSLFIARQLVEAERVRVEEHIDVCETCRAVGVMLVRAAEASTRVGGVVKAADVTEERLYGGRFRVEHEAGRGGMGTVYRARDELTGAAVALKVMRRGMADVGRFGREIRVLADLSHPAVVRYVDHGQTANDCTFLVMEWLEGANLAARLKEGPLTVDEVVTLGVRIAGGLVAVHERGIVHRDIKPGNLMLSGGVEEVKIVDFGLARSEEVESQLLTVSGALLGTPGYMAPEQARGESSVTSAVDVFGFGCVLHHALSGRPPFSGSDPLAVLLVTALADPQRPSEFRADVPEALDDLVMKMLSKLPGDRPDAMGVHALLQAIQHDMAESCAPLSRLPPSQLARFFSVVLLRSRGRQALDPGSGVLAVVAQFGGKSSPVRDGSLVVELAGAGTPEAQARRAADCALALLYALPGAAIAVATARGLAEDAAAVIDRASVLLPPHGDVWLDEVTALLLGSPAAAARLKVASTGGFVLCALEPAARAVAQEGAPTLASASTSPSLSIAGIATQRSPGPAAARRSVYAASIVALALVLVVVGGSVAGSFLLTRNGVATQVVVERVTIHASAKAAAGPPSIPASASSSAAPPIPASTYRQP